MTMDVTREYKLADLISALGAEIREAQRRANETGQPKPVFYLGECSVELGLTWEKTAEGGLEFWVVKLGGGVTKQDTTTISITLKPIDPVAVVGLR
jgi:uncharacterized protein (DUF736 family)